MTEYAKSMDASQTLATSAMMILSEGKTKFTRRGKTMSILIEYPVIAYKAMAIDVHTGDKKLDYEIEKQLNEDLKKYRYNPEHKHVK